MLRLPAHDALAGDSRRHARPGYSEQDSHSLFV